MNARSLALALAAATLVAVPGAALADTMAGPTLTNNIGDWDDSGMQFTALGNVTITGFTYENQGNADSVRLLDANRAIVQTVSVPAGQPMYAASVSWPLVQGQTYYIIWDTPNNGRWAMYTAFPTTNNDISVVGVWNNSTATAYTSWWFGFTDIVTGGGGGALTADAGGPYSGLEGTAMAITGAGSTPATSIVQYQWDCEGDQIFDITSATPTGACTYGDEGTFTVVLQVTNSAGLSASDTTPVTIANVAPTPSIAGPTSINEGSSASFVGSATDPGTTDTLTYAWAFGDGTTATGAAASHTYTQSGSYTVTLTVTDNDGGVGTATSPLTVNNVAPTANAGANQSGNEGSVLTFTGSATDPGADTLTYAWSFGDGTSGAGATATHTYADNGAFTVTLTVTDGDGGTGTDTLTATINNVAPVANAGANQTGNEGAILTFAGSATDAGAADTHTYSWAFGDGTTGSGASVTHAYADNGVYTATLTVTDDDGAPGADTATITVNNVNPVANAGPNQIGVEGATLTFTGAATDGGSADTFTYLWAFGDGATSTSQVATHAYADNGSYTATLTVTDDDGGAGTDTATVSVSNVPPVVNAGPNQGAAETVAVTFSGSFTDAGTADTHTFLWDFGDGATSTASLNPSHTYAVAGTYTVTLTVTDDDGGVGSDTAIATVSNSVPTVNAGAAATGNEGSSVAFSGSFTDGGSGHTFLWDFGDGTTTPGTLTPTHTYADDGLYTVTLTVTDSGGAAGSGTTTATIANVAPTANAGPNRTGAEGGTISFAGSSTDPGTADTFTYAWTFGDGGTGTGASVSHVYTDNGTYTATLTVTDDDGGTDTDTATATISNVNPVANAGPNQSLPEGTPAVMAGSATDAGAADTFTYAWTFGDGASGTGATPSHTYIENGTYTATLTVTDDDGGTGQDSAIITVTNVAPTIATMTGPSNLVEGSPGQYGATATDPGTTDTFTFNWNFGDGSTAVGANPSHTFANEGTYTVSVSVSDDDGGTSTSSTLQTVVSNAAPVVGTVTAPASIVEGTSTTLSVAFTDAGVNDQHTFAWTFGDSTTSTSAAPSKSWDDDGTYAITVTVTDDGGLSSTGTASVLVTNGNPTVVGPTGPSTANEGALLTFSGSATDPGPLDTFTYAWTFGDGFTGTGPIVTHAYPDDGAYVVTLTVTDDDGGTGSASLNVTVANVAPTVTAVGPSSSDEGSPITFTATGSDAGPTDAAALTYSWDWGDGTAPSGGATSAHAYGDEGSYSVTVTVTDPQGATGAAYLLVAVANVAPTITSTAPLFAAENVLWSYLPAAQDPGNDTFTWTLSPGAPTGMTINASTGLVSWTPGFADVGAHPATITVDDGDLGTDTQSFTVQVGFEDDDGDGLADTWETANGLDPTNPNDGALDPDGDNLSNLEEFLGGTDPNVFDGPAAPVLLAPIQGLEVATATPDLQFANAFDPQAEVLEYQIEIYSNETLTNFVASVTGYAEDGSGVTTWVPAALPENSWNWWRVRAEDAVVFGPWSSAEPFFVNTVNEEPSAPVGLFPKDGETVGILQPTAQWSDSVDPDEDRVTYRVRVWELDSETMVTEGIYDPSIGARQVEWLVDVTLAEDVWYEWEVQAIDEHALEGPWSDSEPFLVSADNAAPDAVVFIAPIDASTIETEQPDLVATESVDPEGTQLVYVFAVDTSDAFNSPDLAGGVALHTGTGEVTFSLEDEGLRLREDVLWHARVRAEDEEGLGSEWDYISFFVRGDNDPPDRPELLSPDDGEVSDTATPTFVFSNVHDPEGDAVTYELVVAWDIELTDVILASETLQSGVGPEGTEEQTSWVATSDLPEGILYWSARAIDEFGAPSDWVYPFAVVVELPEAPPGNDTEGCACEGASLIASPHAPGVAWLLVFAGAALALRRRRS